MAIEGPLRELGIHDVFQLLDLSRKTGRLRVSSALRDNEGEVYFKDGRVISATVRSNPHPLGAILRRAVKGSELALEDARARQQAAVETRRLGEILIEMGAITKRELDREVKRQVEAVVFELMSWQEGFFSFAEADLDGMTVEATTTVTTEALLMEGARRIDEWAQVQLRIPHMGVIPQLAPVDPEHPAAIDLLPSEWEVLAAIDGERDLRCVASTLARGELEIAKVALGLTTTGVIVLREPAAPSVLRSEPAELATLLNDAREALRTSNGEEGLSYAATAIALAPGDAEARLLMARALFLVGREMEGEEELRHALTLDPRSTNALMEAARLATRRGELGQAIAYWQRVVALTPGSLIAEQARDAIAHASRLSAMLEAVDA